MALFHFDSETLCQLRRGARMHPHARYRLRCQILLRGTAVKTAREVARQLSTNCAAVRSAKQRFDDLGFDGLLDRRAANGRNRLKVTPAYERTVAELLCQSPREQGFEGARWTPFAIARAAARRTGLLVSRSTAARLLARLQSVHSSAD